MSIDGLSHFYCVTRDEEVLALLYEMREVFDKIDKMEIKSQTNCCLTAARDFIRLYTDGNNVHLESGKNCPNVSNISTPRTLDKENLNAVFEEYKNGSKLSDVTKITFNSVYWFGIFKVLKL